MTVFNVARPLVREFQIVEWRQAEREVATMNPGRARKAYEVAFGDPQCLKMMMDWRARRTRAARQ